MTQYLNVPPVICNPNNCNIYTLVDVAASFADVTTAGYLNAQVDKGHVYTENDLVFVKYDSGLVGFTLSIDADGIITLVQSNAQSGSNLIAGENGTSGYTASYPATPDTGYLKMQGVANSGDYITTISNAAMGQASVISIPDPGAATSKFVLQDGTNTVVSIANLKYGATPVAQVDPASCTISAAAGAANTATVTVQLKDGSGTNMDRIIPFRVYASSAADGLTLASAASTGFSVASGGLSLNNGAAITTQISAMSSATGGCVLSLLDTAKQTSYLVLVLANGCKISAQLSAGSYG